jgi:hypothetical protein
MITVRLTTDVPDDRRVVLTLPPEVPTGPADSVTPTQLAMILGGLDRPRPAHGDGTNRRRDALPGPSRGVESGMPPTADIDDLRRNLSHAEVVIVELRGVAATAG